KFLTVSLYRSRALSSRNAGLDRSTCTGFHRTRQYDFRLTYCDQHITDARQMPEFFTQLPCKRLNIILV
ncbi:hypothetical protein, partial [Pseudomonas syringae]